MGRGRQKGMWKCCKCYKFNVKENASCAHCNPARKKPVPRGRLGREVGTWKCKECRTWNMKTDLRCKNCKADKPVKNKSLPRGERQRGRWKCPRCKKFNEDSATICRGCMAMREYKQYGIVQGEEIQLFNIKKNRDNRFIELNEQGRLKKEDRKVLVTVQEG